ncbi:MAG: hypothetical protein WDN00_04105 [Limisphaerales bacterium]
MSLTFNNQLYSDNRLYGSSNVLNWIANQLGIETVLPVNNTNIQSTSLPTRFFRAAQIQYASSTFAPKSMFGKTLTMYYTNGIIGTNIVNFDSSGGGTFMVAGAGTGTISSYFWNQLPYNGQIPLIVYSAGISPMLLKLNFKTATSGNLTGIYYQLYPYGPAFSGTFTCSP